MHTNISLQDLERRGITELAITAFLQQELDGYGVRVLETEEIVLGWFLC